MSRRTTAPLVVAGLALTFAALVPGAAHAQLGKLKKAATEAAKDKAGIKKEDAPSAKEDFVITAERLDAVLAFVEPQAKKAEVAVAGAAAKKDYDASVKAFEKCLNGVTSGGMAIPTPEAAQRASAITQKVSSMSQRAQKALADKQYRTYVATSDTLNTMNFTATLIMLGAESKCKLAYKPAAVVDAEAAETARQYAQGESGNGSSLASIAPSARAGMTYQQFGMVRERAALWSLQQTNNAPVGNSKYSVFTAAEQSVLDARGDRLKKLAPYFKGNNLPWLSWGDIANW